jgi:hypothetical protein
MISTLNGEFLNTSPITQYTWCGSHTSVALTVDDIPVIFKNNLSLKRGTYA